jgi:hypothetical protein
MVCRIAAGSIHIAVRLSINCCFNGWLLLALRLPQGTEDQLEAQDSGQGLARTHNCLMALRQIRWASTAALSEFTVTILCYPSEIHTSNHHSTVRDVDTKYP